MITDTIPTTPTLVLIKPEYICIEVSPSLTLGPITGTTVLIANLSERIPRESAFEATAVLIDNTVIKADEIRDSPVIRNLLMSSDILSALTSSLIAEHIPKARTQLSMGTTKLLQKKLINCAIPRSRVFVLSEVSVPPETPTIMQNAGKKAKAKSAQILMVEYVIFIQSVIYVHSITVIIKVDA